MAIVKHTTSKNMSYGDVLDYFSYKHKEDSKKGLYEPVLDAYGFMQEREDYAIACLDPQGQEADPEDWCFACLQTNLAFGKNMDKRDRKQHQYIISHPQEDRPKQTMEDLLAEGRAFVRENLQGYDALIAVHRDTDNDHIHICINSVRAAAREPQPWMTKDDRGNVLRSEICAGGKHQDNPEFRRHYNDWLLEYTRAHGLTQKDNNALAQQHKQERYQEKNQALADAIREAAKDVYSLAGLSEKLEAQKIFLLKRGKDYCVLGPGNRNAVRLETLGLQPEELPMLQDEKEQQFLENQSAEFQVEKRKYIEWVQQRREKNAAKAEDALADAAALLADRIGTTASREEFRELRGLVKQTIYLQRDLATELQKVDRMLQRWERYQDPNQSKEQHRQDARFIRWCGCDPDSQTDFESLLTCRDMIRLQVSQVQSVQEALNETSDQWRTFTDAFPLEEDPIAKRDQLSQKLATVRANRKKLEQIAFRCEDAARRRIYKDKYLDKAAHFRELWHQKLLQEEALKAQLKQVNKDLHASRRP